MMKISTSNFESYSDILFANKIEIFFKLYLIV
jgi:hypothetical protein